MIHLAKPQITEDEIKRVEAVLRSGMIASGAVVTEFEGAFARYIGAKHGIATSNGTTALHAALESVGIRRGDRVITTPFTFIASSNSIRFTGATPIFCDIDPRTYNLDPEAVRSALKKDPSIKAILLVHLYGLPCDMNAFLQIKKEFGVLIVEDCAQAHGAEFNGKKVGGIGDISAFSFYATKNMTTGEGGMVLCNDDAFAARARKLINHGRKSQYEHDILGYNHRLTNMAAAIGVSQLGRLESFNSRRREIAGEYDAAFKANGKITVPFVPPTSTHVYHQYTIRVSNRDGLKAHLEKKEVQSAIVYPIANCLQEAYAGISSCRTRGDCSHRNTTKASDEVLSLPVHPGLSAADVQKVIEAVKSYE
jgi:dTDP-4-amino-4,6-dideoxygalactose transaminase